MTERIIYTAPPLKLDIDDARAWLGEAPLALSTRPLQLLAALMETPERLITKEELIEQVWEGRAVSDAVLTTAMRELRHALGDKAREPEFIETVHGRGYRFLKPVTRSIAVARDQHATSESSSVELASSNYGKDLITPVLIIAGLMLGLVFLLPMLGRGSNPISIPNSPVTASTSIAVLAFEDLSEGGDQEYFSDGVSEEILNSLVKLEGLNVAGRTSSFSFKGRNTDTRTIGEALNVEHILEGSVRRQGDKVRITAQLIAVDNGFHVWSNVYERDTDDIFSIQDEIARAVAGELQILLADDSGSPLVTAVTKDKEAYRLYLQGRALLAKRIGNNLTEAIPLFQQAIQRDPEFARAYSALAAAYAVQPDYRYDIDPAIAAENARRAAERAIELDSALAQPHAVLGLIAFDARDYVQSRQAFDRASDLDPNNLDTLYWKSTLFRSVGDYDAAASLSTHAVELDPISPLGYVTKAMHRLAIGDLEVSARLAERARDLGHPSGNYILAKIAELNGDGNLASRLHTESFFDSGVSTRFSEDDVTALLRGVYGSPEEAAIARAKIDEYAQSNAPKRDILAPNILFDLGDMDAALALFEQSETTLDQFFLGPVWSSTGTPARQSPRFASFAENTGMVAYWNVYGWPDACAPVSADASPRQLCVR